VTTTINDRADSEAVWMRRLGACSDTIAALGGAREDEIETRDELIVKAIDLGWPRRQVARWAKVSETRVTQIIAARCAE